MGNAGLVLFFLAILAIAILAWAAFTSKRFLTVASVALVVAGTASFLAYYALVESQSVPWALGYGIAALLSTAVAGRHFVGKLSNPEG